ncbi:putative ribonuclease H-like domain-containing protein [Tanacetum coccineum]
MLVHQFRLRSLSQEEEAIDVDDPNSIVTKGRSKSLTGIHNREDVNFWQRPHFLPMQIADHLATSTTKQNICLLAVAMAILFVKSTVVSTTFVEQFWTSAKSKTINNVRHITAKVAGKSVSISEASIRSDLLFDDADGIDSLPNQTIFDAIQQMGSKSTSWDQIPTNIATAVICLTTNQKYNFSKLIFDGKQLANVSVPLDHFPVNTLTSKVFSFMVKKGKHFSGKVTPLFATMLVQPTQDEGASSERPSEALPTPSPAPTSEIPLEPQPDSSPAQTSEVPIEHQPTLSPRPSPTTTIPDSIPETSGENLGDQAKEIQDLKAQITKLKKQAKPVIKHHKEYLKSVSLKQRFPRKRFSKKHRVHKESISKQGRKFAKGESSVQRDPLFDEVPEDTVDHMDTENAQDEGRTREIVDEDKEIEENVLSTEDVLSTDKEGVSTDIEKVSTDRPIVSTDGSKVSTDKPNEGTDEQVEGTEEPNEGTEEQNEDTVENFEGTEENMVFIPINEPRQHWCLAEFDIFSGVVTFYDSGDSYDVECHD